MNRIASVMVMHSRSRGSWFLTPLFVLSSGFTICLLIALSIHVFWSNNIPVYTGALATIYIVMVNQGAISVTSTFPFAVGFSVRRRDYLLGTLAMAAAVSAAFAILLMLFSLIEINLIPHWGLGLHFFHPPYFSDGSPLQQFWVYFVVMLFMYLLGFVPGTIYYRFGRAGMYVFFALAFLLLSFFLLASSYWSWWGNIFGWFVQQGAFGVTWWMLPLMGCFALVSYALLRKATV